MLFSFVLLVSLVFCHSFYAAPVDEAKDAISSDMSSTITAETVERGPSFNEVVDDYGATEKVDGSQKQLGSSRNDSVLPGAIEGVVICHYIKGKELYQSHLNCISYAYENGTFLDRQLRLIPKPPHTRERPFVCTLNGCVRTFSRKEDLKRHINVAHSEQDSLRLDNNRASFVDAMQHQAVFRNDWTDWNRVIDVTESRDFIHDNHINKGTLFYESKWKNFFNANTKDNLKTQSGERPFVCSNESCNKAFAHSSSFYRHLKKYDSPLSCEWTIIDESKIISNNKASVKSESAPLVDLDKDDSILKSVKRPLQSDQEEQIDGCKRMKRIHLTDNSMEMESFEQTNNSQSLTQIDLNEPSYYVSDSDAIHSSKQNNEKQVTNPYFNLQKSTPLNDKVLAPLLLTLGRVKQALLFNGKLLADYEPDNYEDVRIKVLNDYYVFNFNIPFESVTFWYVKCTNNELRIYLERNNANEEVERYFGFNWNEMLVRAELKWGYCPKNVESTFDTFGQLQITVPRY